MFIKKIDKSNSKTGKTYYTYRLCESYRIENKVRHRNILNPGLLEGIRKEDFKLLCDRIEQKVKGITVLPQYIGDEEIEKQMEAEIISRTVHLSPEPDTVLRMEHERSLNEVLSLHKTPDHRKLYGQPASCMNTGMRLNLFMYRRFESKYPDRMPLCLYGLTNFYFEGRKENSGLSPFGHSKEKCSDAKLISPALLTGGQGFIRHSKFYKGNISEPSALQDVLSEMKEDSKNDVNLFESKPIAVMDAGCNKNIRRQARCTRSHEKQTGQGLLKRQAVNGRKQIWTFVRSIIKRTKIRKPIFLWVSFHIN